VAFGLHVFMVVGYVGRQGWSKEVRQSGISGFGTLVGELLLYSVYVYAGG